MSLWFGNKFKNKTQSLEYSLLFDTLTFNIGINYVISNYSSFIQNESIHSYNYRLRVEDQNDMH